MAHRIVRTALSALLVVGVLAGCTAGGGDDPGPTVAAASTPSPTPTPTASVPPGLVEVDPPSDLYALEPVPVCDCCSEDVVVASSGNEYAIQGLSDYGATADLFPNIYGFPLYQASLQISDASVIAYDASSSGEVATDPAVMQRILDDIVAQGTTGDPSISYGTLVSRSEPRFDQWGNVYAIVEFANDPWSDTWMVVKIIGPQIVLAMVGNGMSAGDPADGVGANDPKEAPVLEQFKQMALNIHAAPSSPTSWEDPEVPAP